MTFEVLKGTPTLTLSPIATVGFALLMFMIGTTLRKKFTILRSYCIPAPVIGGMLYAFINLILHTTGVLAIKLTNTYQADFMNLFFACVALSISMSVVKKGGPRLVQYAICAIVLILIQGVLGVVLSEAVGLGGVFGIVLGPAPLAGGHANVAAYAQFLEDAGYKGTMVTGMAAACFGLVAAGFFGGPMARRLIDKYGLKNENEAERAESEEIKKDTPWSLPAVYYHLVILIVSMVLGMKLGDFAAKSLGVNVPSFTGILLLCLVLRVVDDNTHVFHLDDSILEKMQSFTLNVFLSMAIIALNLWELAELAVPMLIVLVIELIVTLLYIRFVVFNVCGKNFDAAIMCAGLCGHGLGATPNAFANMDSVSQEFGYTPIPYLAVTVTGTIFAAWTLIIVNTFMVNLLV